MNDIRKIIKTGDPLSNVAVDVGRMEPIAMMDGSRMGFCPACNSKIQHHHGDETAPCPRCGTDWICTPSGQILGAA